MAMNARPHQVLSSAVMADDTLIPDALMRLDGDHQRRNPETQRGGTRGLQWAQAGTHSTSRPGVDLSGGKTDASLVEGVGLSMELYLAGGCIHWQTGMDGDDALGGAVVAGVKVGGVRSVQVINCARSLRFKSRRLAWPR
jgi:hypothetical protein